jgi:hypothetical protein
MSSNGRGASAHVHDQVLAILRNGSLGMQDDMSEIDEITSLLSALDGKRRRLSGKRLVVASERPSPNAYRPTTQTDADAWVITLPETWVGGPSPRTPKKAKP